MRYLAITLLLASSFLQPILVAGEQKQEPPTIVTSSDDATVLRAQLQIMRDADQRLLSTVYWALGTLISVTIVVAVLGWYMNFHVYERDRESVKQELSAMLTSKQAELEKGVRQSLSKLDSDLRELITQRLAASEERLRTVAQSAAANVEYTLTHLRYDFSELKGKWEEQQGSLLGAWFEYRNMLITTIEMGESWPGYALEHLKRILKAGVRLNHHHVLEISHLLERVPSGYSADVATIEHLVKLARE
jgi:hypothetical protein